jgi:ferritin
MLSDKMELKLNEQINKELYSAYLYMSMSAYFSSVGLDGFANYYRVQATEEEEHAMKFYDYVLRVGGRVRFEPIEGPKVDFESTLEIVDMALKHEEYVTGLINSLMGLAVSEKDYKTSSLLQWFIDEQVEEEENANNLKNKVKLMGNDPKGLWMLDMECAKRVYTSPAKEGK